MPHMTKTFMTAFTALAMSFSATPAEAKHDKPCQKENHSYDQQYNNSHWKSGGYPGHSHGNHSNKGQSHKSNPHSKQPSHHSGHSKHDKRNYNYKENYRYSMYVPKYLKHSHHKTPLLIVITDDDNYAHYRKHYSNRADKKGFVVAYAKRKHSRSHDENIITALLDSIIYDYPIDVRKIYIRHH